MLRSFAIWFLSMALLAAGYDGLTSTASNDLQTTPTTFGEDGTPLPPNK
jgi:hypothetical protein